MLTSTRRAALLAAAVVLVPALSSAQGAAPASTRTAAADLSPRLDAYMQAQMQASGFSGAVLIAQDGKPVFAGGYGWANAEWEIPNTTTTRFRIGSVTKQFTSMAVMRMQAQGRLDVGDPICSYLAPCPEAWKPVTIHHLLTHTSGIPSYTNSPEYVKTMMIPKTVDEMVAGFRDLPLEFAPGSQFKYDNSGYFLLGLILEKVSGRKYEDLLRAEIFEPLGMNDTGYDRPDVVLPRRAAGYTRRGGTLANAAYLDMVQPFSAGALYSTVEDLLKWDQALYTEKLLPAGARDAMFTPFKEGYGYGWAIRPASPQTLGHRTVEHSGGINGFSSMIARVPDEKVTVIVLGNNESAPASRVARDLLALYFNQPVQAPVVRKVAAVDPAIYDAYVGDYQLAPGFVITVRRDGDRLIAQATGQPGNEIFPESATTFFLRVVDAQITFVRDAAGAVTHLVLHQNGRDQKALRVR